LLLKNQAIAWFSWISLHVSEDQTEILFFFSSYKRCIKQRKTLKDVRETNNNKTKPPPFQLLRKKTKLAAENQENARL
jgi:hypothetical protein